jgi:hypothetical protein
VRSENDCEQETRVCIEIKLGFLGLNCNETVTCHPGSYIYKYTHTQTYIF